jgi:uncharacterized protein DUF6379
VGPLDKDVVRDDALSATEDGLALQIHSHWYRALPLTSLAVVDLTIDGEPIDSSALEVEANGERLAFDELQHRYDDWWFTTDAVTLHVPRGNGRGTSHRIELDLGLLIPYLIVGGPNGEPLLASSHTDKTLACN